MYDTSQKYFTTRLFLTLKYINIFRNLQLCVLSFTKPHRLVRTSDADVCLYLQGSAEFATLIISAGAQRLWAEHKTKRHFTDPMWGSPLEIRNPVSGYTPLSANHNTSLLWSFKQNFFREMENMEKLFMDKRNMPEKCVPAKRYIPHSKSAKFWCNQKVY